MTRPSEALPRYSVVRQAKRAVYDEAVAHAILDAGLVAHVGFVADDRPMVIPMAYGRDGATLYIHGASTTRIIKAVTEEAPVCLTVTHIDGIVAARSAFNSSVNYRSVVVHGSARRVRDFDEHDHALRIITEHLMPGRWSEVRPTLDKERRATGVLAVGMEAVSAKVRTGGPIDEEADYALPIWGGVLPLRVNVGLPVSDCESAKAPIPGSLSAASAKFGSS